MPREREQFRSLRPATHIVMAQKSGQPRTTPNVACPIQLFILHPVKMSVEKVIIDHAVVDAMRNFAVRRAPSADAVVVTGAISDRL